MHKVRYPITGLPCFVSEVGSMAVEARCLRGYIRVLKTQGTYEERQSMGTDL